MASKPPKAPTVYTVSGLTGTPDERIRRIGGTSKMIGGHITIIELREGESLKLLA